MRIAFGFGAGACLPGDYTKQAKAVAERQGVLASYRLADDTEHRNKPEIVLKSPDQIRTLGG